MEPTLHKERKEKRPAQLLSLKRQIVSAGWLFCIVIALLLVTFLLNSIYTYQREGREKRIQDITSYGETIEENLSLLRDIVTTIYSQNNAFDGIDAYPSPLEKWNDIYELLNILRIQVNSNQSIGGLFVYYDSFDKVQYAFNEQLSTDELNEIKEAGRIILKSEEDIYNTALLETEANILYNIYMKKNTAALGGSISLSQGLPDEKDNKAVYGIIYEGEFYPSWEEGSETDILYEEMPTDWISRLFPGQNYLNGNYIYLHQLNQADMAVVEILPKNIWLYINQIHILLMVMIVLFVIAAVWLMHFVYHELSIPLADMTKALENIKEGVWEVKFQAPNRISEIEDVREAVKRLLAEIEEYKIRFYEKELEKAKIQRQYLQLQLAPHFYTNCLKNVYYMLALKEYDNAEIFLQRLSVHLRYLLQKDAAFVTVEKEMDFVKNYVDLQKLMTSKSLSCNIQVDKDVLDWEIPILSLQTFVENSVKYARDEEGGQLKIKLSVRHRKTEEGSYLDITARDNGPGYPKELLEVINQKNPTEKEGMGVGVINLQSRIRLFYGDSASWFFENQGGAVSELILPEEKEEQK